MHFTTTQLTTIHPQSESRISDPQNIMENEVNVRLHLSVEVAIVIRNPRRYDQWKVCLM